VGRTRARTLGLNSFSSDSASTRRAQWRWLLPVASRSSLILLDADPSAFLSVGDELSRASQRAGLWFTKVGFLSPQSLTALDFRRALVSKVVDSPPSFRTWSGLVSTHEVRGTNLPLFCRPPLLIDRPLNTPSGGPNLQASTSLTSAGTSLRGIVQSMPLPTVGDGSSDGPDIAHSGKQWKVLKNGTKTD